MATISSNVSHVIPIAGRYLPNIFSTAIKIVKKVEEVKINKRQCQTLIDRLQTVISYLQTPSLLKRLRVNNDPLNQTLENFQRFLELCYDFISVFVDRSRIRRFISSSTYKEEFKILNDQLQIYYSELTFGINIKNLIDKKQDEHDQNEDLHQLLKIVIEQNNYLIENQTKRFDRLEKILIQNHVQLQSQLTIQSAEQNHLFKNGIWWNRCFEYGKWHGPCQHQIIFNFNDNICYGCGKDHIGSFILTGSFSKETQQMNIVLSYQVCQCTSSVSHMKLSF
jgi:hypothetical protein